MNHLQSDSGDQQSSLNPDNEVFLRDFLENYRHLERILEQKYIASKEAKNTADKGWKPLAGKLASDFSREITQILENFSDISRDRKGQHHRVDSYELFTRFLRKYPQWSENVGFPLPERFIDISEIDPVRIANDDIGSKKPRGMTEVDPGKNIEDLSLFRYRTVLLAEGRKLENIDIEIREEDGVYFFENVKHWAFWSKINGIHLKNFPSNAFNKKHAIGDRSGIMSTPEDLRKLFPLLGLKTASEYEERARLREIYETHFLLWANHIIQSLENEISEKNGIWYFPEDRRTTYRPRYQYRFPIYDGDFSRFVRGYKVGSVNSVGDYWVSHDDVIRLLEVFGLRVATDEEAIKKQWKEILFSSEEGLREIGVVQKDDIWYFPEFGQEFSGEIFLHKIQQDSHNVFPDVHWNWKQGIGDSFGEIQTREHLRQLFRALGLRVATKEEESGYLADFSKILENIATGLHEDISSESSNQGVDSSKNENYHDMRSLSKNY